MKIFTASVACLAMALAFPAIAATDGTLGPTSSGTFTVSASISPTASADVQVYGLDDFSFSGNEGNTINSQSKGFCITSTGGTGLVDLTISSFDAADTYFRVKTPGGAEEVQMLLIVDKLGVGPEQVQLVEGTPSQITVWPTCTEGSNEDDYLLSISLLNTTTAAPGNYSGSFLVTVAPN